MRFPEDDFERTRRLRNRKMSSSIGQRGCRKSYARIKKGSLSIEHRTICNCECLLLVFRFHCCVLPQAGISMSPSESAAHIRSTLTPNQNPTRLCRKDPQCPRSIRPSFPVIHRLLRRRLNPHLAKPTSSNTVAGSSWGDFTKCTKSRRY